MRYNRPMSQTPYHPAYVGWTVALLAFPQVIVIRQVERRFSSKKSKKVIFSNKTCMESIEDTLSYLEI